MSTAYHTQTDKQIGVFNRFTTIFKVFLSRQSLDQGKYLNVIEQHYNTSVHDAILFTISGGLW